jgi:hypothetical protein
MLAANALRHALIALFFSRCRYISDSFVNKEKLTVTAIAYSVLLNV